MVPKIRAEWFELTWPAHTTSNFAPNEYREVVNLFGLVVYKGSNTRVESNGDYNRKGNKSSE